MSEKMIGQVVFLRHGETNYTDVFPDLTIEGKRTIQRSAEKIKWIFENQKRKLLMVCSPAVRARGSASIIAQYLDFQNRIRQVDLLRSVGVRDIERGKAIMGEYLSNGGHFALSSAYSTDERYENPEIFEPRSQVIQRFYKYLKRLATDMQNGTIKHFVVAVSHYEVLHNLVEKFFRMNYEKVSPLTFGELIVIRFHGIPGGTVQRLSVEFRNWVENDIWLR